MSFVKHSLFEKRGSNDESLSPLNIYRDIVTFNSYVHEKQTSAIILRTNNPPPPSPTHAELEGASCFTHLRGIHVKHKFERKGFDVNFEILFRLSCENLLVYYGCALPLKYQGTITLGYMQCQALVFRIVKEWYCDR